MSLKEPQNVIDCANRLVFRQWLQQHASIACECWLRVKRGKPQWGCLSYIDAVEEALCFGWIDSVYKTFPAYGLLQRFTRRTPRSHWTELNKARVHRLEQLGLMTDVGRAVVPTNPFKIHPELQKLLDDDGDLAKKFYSFPKLYQRVRLDGLQSNMNAAEYERRKAYFIQQTKLGKLYGQWNDYGRLTDPA